jgi:hypothetical protein
VTAPRRRGRPAVYESTAERRKAEYAVRRRRRAEARSDPEKFLDHAARKGLLEPARPQVREPDGLLGLGVTSGWLIPVQPLSVSDRGRLVEEVSFWHGPAVDVEADGFWESEERLTRFALNTFAAACADDSPRIIEADPAGNGSVRVVVVVPSGAADAAAEMIACRDPARSERRTDIRAAVEPDPNGSARSTRRDWLDSRDIGEARAMSKRYPLPPWLNPQATSFSTMPQAETGP